MNFQHAKEKVKGLVDKYQNVVNSGKLKSYSEEETKLGFILPLFEMLGWNTKDKNEVSAEEQMKSRGRVDFGFYLNGIVKFYLEAKPLKANLDKEEYAKQAIRYSWHKGVTWAILTDFESIKVFNALAGSKLLQDKLVFEISHKDYIEDFDRLWLLSKESFENNSLDKYAEKYGKKLKKLTVNEKLYNDLKLTREILTKSLGDWNKKVDQETLEEGVQRILDRLVFIRVLEDKGLEPQTLIPILREWEADQKRNQLFPMLINKFRELDEIYNSNIFAKHACEQWEEYDDSIKKVINILYGGGMYEYDFKEIPADILGGVYESYLGYMAQNPIKDDKKEIKAKSRQKRKEQGIYYTPKFIVDYIVANTLGKKLDEVKNIHELKKIKILDPACGSGSFLTKALEVMNDKYKEFGNRGDQYTKSEILTSNIYGVDLDAQAVEIAKLNLLVEALDKKAKLPDLTNNIRVGNSLISGSEEELKKYFGKDWRDKKPFNWKEEFPFCRSDQPVGGEESRGFDIIIGNPPYVVLDSDIDELPLFKEKYKSSQGGKANLYKLFIERAISLLKEGGYLGFICPSNYISSADSYALRKIILENTNMIEIIEYSEKEKVFTNVTQSLTTIILKKDKNPKVNLHIKTVEQGDNIINQEEFRKNKELEFVFVNKVISKMNESKKRISDFADCYQGEINVSTKKDLFIKNRIDNSLRLLRGNLISHYKLLSEPDEYCPLAADKRGHWKNQRVVFQEVSNRQQKRRIKAVLVGNNVLCGHTTNYCFSKNYSKNNNLLILAILNSNLINYYFSYFNKTNHVPVGEIKNIPLPQVDIKSLEEISNLSGKMLELNKQLQSIPENSDKWKSAKAEIEKTDKLIDQKVYELYNLNEEEIKIIEN